MAGPQLGDGFTRIANELLDAVCRYKFNGAQFRLIMKVWRQTYGYSKKENKLAITYLIEATGLSESAVKKEMKALIDANVLIVTKRQTKIDSRHIMFNKNYNEWKIPKSGDEMADQLNLFSSDQVHDCTPNDSNFKVDDCDPHQVDDCVPRNDFKVHDCDPNKEIKDLKKSFKEKEAMFETFYGVYPRKQSKKKAQEIWKRLCKKEGFDPDVAILGAKNYGKTCKQLETELKYIAHPTTFLNQERWSDYPTVDPEGLAAGKQSKFSSNLDFFCTAVRWWKQ